MGKPFFNGCVHPAFMGQDTCAAEAMVLAIGFRAGAKGVDFLFNRTILGFFTQHVLFLSDADLSALCIKNFEQFFFQQTIDFLRLKGHADKAMVQPLEIRAVPDQQPALRKAFAYGLGRVMIE